MKKKPLDELEEAAWDCVLDSIDVNNPVLLPKYKELLLYLFIAGAEWRKKHLAVEDIKAILDISFWNDDPQKILEEYNRICDTSKVTRR